MTSGFLLDPSEDQAFVRLHHAELQEQLDGAVIRIILAHSQAVYRVGILQVLSSEIDMQVVARPNTLEKVQWAVERFFSQSQTLGASLRPIILLDGNIISGAVNAISELVRRAPQAKIITQLDEKDESNTNTVELYLRGVRGIIPHSVSPDLLVKCIRKVAAGEAWIDNQSVNRLIEAYQAETTKPRNQPPLSPKELAIITCITQGKRNKEIASQLDTTEQVIKNYLRKLYNKLGVSDRIELALYGLGNQLDETKSESGFLQGASVPAADILSRPNGVSRLKRTIHAVI
jgi:two-component system, NarL family, nitrate/nitrite response regulator NarL